MHFTYCPKDKENLYQGDIIKRNVEIISLLKDYGPNFAKDEDIKFFTILTQSCDLIQRNGHNCKTDYIKLAAVKPLKTVLNYEISRFQYDPIEKKLKIINNKVRPKLIQFMERLFNNNEGEYYFYFKEPLLGLDDDSCAILREVITVPTEIAYEILLNSKLLQLKESFQHKLGHTLGELYSRVGTEDWLPHYCTNERFREYVNAPLDDSELVLWLEEYLHKKILKKLKSLEDNNINHEILAKTISELKETKSKRIEGMLDTIQSALEELDVDTIKIKQIRQLLSNKPTFRNLIK